MEVPSQLCDQRTSITIQWTMSLSAWPYWGMIESSEEVEAAKGVPYRRTMLTATKLSPKVYICCCGGGL